MTTPQESIDRLTRVRAAMVQAGPEHFDMSHWYHDQHGARDLFQATAFNPQQCGTTLCLAGFGAIEMAKDGLSLTNDHQTSGKIVADWLGIEDLLFYVSHWDTDLANRHSEATSSFPDSRVETTLDVGLDMIDRLIDAARSQL